MKLLESKGVEIFLNTRLTDYNGRTVTRRRWQSNRGVYVDLDGGRALG